MIMKLDLDFLFVCVDAQYHKNPKFTFFTSESRKYPKNTQILSNSSDLTLFLTNLKSFG